MKFLDTTTTFTLLLLLWPRCMSIDSLATWFIQFIIKWAS